MEDKQEKTHHETVKLDWQNIPFTLSLRRGYFSPVVGFAHMEVRCEEPLPITETGYRSIFIHQEYVPDLDTAASIVLDNMEKAALERKWHRDMQQSLF